MPSINLPDGWTIERKETRGCVEFKIYEPNGPTWDSGAPRDSLTVTLWLPEPDGFVPTGPQVGWPSTSDKRPVLAQAVAVAIAMAAEEANSR
jgi:hypothetical protein